MKKTTKLVCILVSTSIVFFNLNLVAYSPYQVYKKDRIDLNLTTNFFKSQANFTADGSQQTLIGSNYFQSLDFTSYLRWELIEDIGFIGGFNIASSESSDAASTRKNSALNRVDLGFDYLFWNSDIHETFFRMIYSQPIEKIALNTDSVSNSDGATEIKPEVVMRFNLDGWYPYAQAGINYRSEGLSMLATYAAGLEMRFTEIGIGASVIGRTSIKDDDMTGTSSLRDAVNTRVNAGSKKYFAVNPNSTDLAFNLNFSANENLLFTLFGGYTLLGSNSAVGYNAGLSMNYDFGTSSHARPQSQNLIQRKQKQKSTENLNTISREPTPNDFKEDTNDGVNQEYFKPVAPAQKNYVNQLEGSQQNLNNATAPDLQEQQANEAAAQQAKQNDEVKKQLNNMEYTIKLKKKKKRLEQKKEN